MPRATVSTDTERFDLKSLPEGYVVLRRMPYGQLLERREMAAKMAIEAGGSGRDTKGSIQMMQRQVAEFEARHCIVDHNLTDESDNILNFKQPGVFLTLDPRVGEEIGQLIDQLNQFEEVEAGN